MFWIGLGVEEVVERVEKRRKERVDPEERRRKWAAMIDRVEIKNRAQLARHLGVSRRGRPPLW